MKLCYFTVLLIVFIGFTNAQSRMLRYPDVYKDKVVFVYGGDIWIASTQGGFARQLTSHPGMEIFPKFSPDGKLIAFSGEYDGVRSVYVIPTRGGIPKKLTYMPAQSGSFRHGYDNMVVGWLPDGKHVVFRSWRDSFDTWFAKLFKVSLKGGLPEKLPLPESGLASFSPDGSKVVYNRIFRDFRTWKRYYGGLAQDIWVYDFKKNKTTRITKWKGSDVCPMWGRDHIYFVSDRNNKANIFSYNLKNKKITQLTQHGIFDVKWASIGENKIVYENGGWLYVYSIEKRKTQKLHIKVLSEKRWKRPYYVNAANFITDYSLSPGGEKGLFCARGEIFSVAKKNGRTIRITQNYGHEKHAVYSPDGKYICYISDKSGEEEFYLYSIKEKKHSRLTIDGDRKKFSAIWSPDSKKLLFADKSTRLFFLDIITKKATFITDSQVEEIRDFSWSPDSLWVAYAKSTNERNEFSSIYLYSLEKRKNYRITSELTDDKNPVFSQNGKYLYFRSKRKYSATFGELDFNYTSTDITGIYLITLKNSYVSPFSEYHKEKKNTSKKKKIEIDLKNIENRIIALPIPAGNYFGLTAKKGVLFYASYSPWVMGKPGTPSTLYRFDFKTQKIIPIIKNIRGFDISYDGKKVLYKSGSNFGIVDSTKSHKSNAGKLNLANMTIAIDPGKEWPQIFNEAWRLFRDYFYVKNMHGVNWNLMKERYQALVPHAVHRNDLTYIISEMIGELACSHSYVGGGVYPKFPTLQVGLLGAELKLDKKTNLYTFAKIYQGENWSKRLVSPLTLPGVNVREGDYILAINGIKLQGDMNPYSLLENNQGKYIELTITSPPDLTKTRTITMKTLSSQLGLLYWNWVNKNREYVRKKSGGKLGYLHIPDMSSAGLLAFIKQYRGQVHKQGIVIDVRYNGGGFISQMLLERLRRVVMGMGQGRSSGKRTYPSLVFHGHMVCLINSYSASDGDIFPNYFRKYKLGTLIGRKTWGGVIGIRGYMRLMDGGYVAVPEFGSYDMKSKWNMENKGVSPDLEVDNLPEDVIKGKDAQLDKAIEVLLSKIKKEPKKLPVLPKDPIR